MRVGCQPVLQPVGAGEFPFAVGDTCARPFPGSAVAGFEHAGRSPCDTVVSADRPGGLTLAVRAPVPLVALQGSLRFDHLGLVVGDLARLAATAGMDLRWQRAGTGADFLLAARPGARGGGPVAAGELLPGLRDLLLVGVRADVSGAPDEARLAPRNFLGLTADGRLVCFDASEGKRASDPSARLCAASVAASAADAGGSCAAPAAVALSAPRPNPASGSTGFTLTVPAPQEVEVAVYDLAGRRVTGLYHGTAPAGALELAWDRRAASGARVPPGVYFVRVVAGPATTGRKVLVLTGP
jgi:hypothetical protein